MRTFAGIAAAGDAARIFFYRNEADLPPVVAEKVEPHTRTGANAVDLITTFVKASYANRADVSKETLELAGGLAELIEREGYHRDILGDRIAGMRDALRRDSGEKGTWPKKADDPADDPEFRAPPAPETIDKP